MPGTPRDEKRFIRWLRSSHPSLDAGDVREALGQLTAAGLLGAGSAEAERRVGELAADEAGAQRLLLLHGAWQAWSAARSADAATDGGDVAWVGAPACSDGGDALLWVEADHGVATSAPRGAPPPLVPSSRRRRGFTPPQRRWRPTDLLPPLLVLAVLGAVVVFAVLAERDRRATLARLTTALHEPPPTADARELADLISARAAGLVAARQAQAAVLRERCEGGPWCARREAEVAEGLARAEELLLLLVASDTAPKGRAGPVLAGERAALRQRARALRAEAEEAARSEAPDADLARQIALRRARILDGEADALRDGWAR